jgi:DNA polymerase I-like protein with 3'-5' exonuclease and polymerase domains
MVNEIHDALVLDIKKEYLELIISKVHAILIDVKNQFKENWNINFNVPINVDYKSGKNWDEVKRDA